MRLRTLIKVLIRCIYCSKSERVSDTNGKGHIHSYLDVDVRGVGNKADRHHKRIASLIAEKRRESYADVLNYIRTRLRFCLLKSVLIAIRGFQGKRFKENTTPISSLTFKLIDFDKVE